MKPTKGDIERRLEEAEQRSSDNTAIEVDLSPKESEAIRKVYLSRKPVEEALRDLDDELEEAYRRRVEVGNQG
jgi:hypothetical protein